MQSYTLTNLLVTISHDQAKDGQESTFYMTTPSLISVRLFVCVEVLRPSQHNGVMSNAVSLPNHTFTGQA